VFNDGRSLVQQTVAGGIRVPDHQTALPDPLVGARDIYAIPQRELGQQSASKRHVHLGAGGSQLSGVVVGQEEQRSSARSMNLRLVPRP
jgi:hypothetical protein